MAKDTVDGIEYFIWTKDGQKSDKLIYYDKLGNCIEKPIPAGLLDEPLKLFDGGPRSVRRTTGGVSIAEPHQIVIYQPDEIRIRVRLKDLVRNQEGFVVSPKGVVQMKVLPMTHIEPGFRVHTEEKQTFVIDLGQGLIPIHVFHIESDLQGRRSALFVLQHTLNQAVASARTEKISFSIFRLPVDVLRFAKQEVFQEGLKNAEGLASSNGLYLPDALIGSSPVQVPGGSSLEMVKHFLRISTKPEDRRYIEPLLIRVEKKDELLPFGLFEQP